MNGLGMAGSARPKVKPGDFERAWALIVETGADKATKAYLKELVAASAVHDKARDEADAAAAEAKSRDATARQAEDAARSQTHALALATANARDELGRREVAVGGRETAVAALELTQETLNADLSRRAQLLREAGVELPE